MQSIIFERVKLKKAGNKTAILLITLKRINHISLTYVYLDFIYSLIFLPVHNLRINLDSFNMFVAKHLRNSVNIRSKLKL